MYREENKFLDLDMVAERITDSGDREMFREAIKCYHIGSHRAAVILVWMATADCLERRLEELKSEGDIVARDAIDQVLTPIKGQASFEENLIAQCKKCDLFDDYEEKCLKFARDTRSKCAHPSGVLPSAEAVRHILEICLRIVLCRTGYRGISFIKDVVTVQFDDSYFLPYEERTKESCRRIIDKVPERLWHLFTTLAAQERPNAPKETWRENAIRFFRVLLENCSDANLANKIAKGMQGFESQAPEFFSALVGLDRRVARFWDKQKRDQVRARLASIPLSQVKNYEVESWSTICEQDGFEKDDLELLKQQIPSFSRYFTRSFLEVRRKELFKLIAEMSEEDALTNKAALALNHLLFSPLADLSDSNSKRVVVQIILRFKFNNKYRNLLKLENWKDPLIIQFLELSEEFLLECSEDNSEDIYNLFEAVSELARRNPLLIPIEFYETVKATLKGSIQGEWRTENSAAREIFKRQLELLLERYSSAFSDFENECKDLIAVYLINEGDGNEISENEFSPEDESL